MIRLAIATLAMMSASLVPAQAASLSFTGTFLQDDDLQIFDFSISAPGTVTIQTWGYDGGFNAASQVIVAGGFDPVVSLFDNAGNLLGYNNDGPVSLDAYLRTTLSTAGVYHVVLSQSDNVPTGLTFADGFSQSGNPSFTGSMFGCANGQFCDFLANDRSANFALDILNVDTPEPSTLLLAGPALALLALRARRG